MSSDWVDMIYFCLGKDNPINTHFMLQLNEDSDTIFFPMNISNPH